MTPVTLPIHADIHLHTKHSHGIGTTREMYEAAKSRGLTIIGFSEHSPRPEGYTYPQDYQEQLTKTYSQYIQEVIDLRTEAACEGVEVLLGVEFDFIPARLDFARQFCAAYPYDYIIGGLHFQGTWGFDGPAEEWLPIEQEERFALYDTYYEDLCQLAEAKLFNVVAHPDLIKIHSKDDFTAWLTRPTSIARVTKALTAIRDNGLVMEVSSAGLRKPCQEIYPGPVIMQLAATLDVPISFGSDAHCPNTPAAYFDILAQYAARFGYTTSTIFAHRRPRPIPFTAL